MQLGYISDIHDEHRHVGHLLKYDVETNLDVLILAGDITSSKRIVEYLIQTQQAWQTDVIFVPGNHEYYEEDIDEFTQTLESKFNRNPSIHILQNRSVEIDSIAFHGTTLWTGFDSYGEDVEQNKKNASLNIRDFYAIRRQYKFLKTRDMLNEYKLSRNFLERSLKSNTLKKQIVISHFPPMPELSTCRVNDYLTAYFYANCEDVIREYQPDLWIYGHSHCSTNLEVSNTKILSNQIGYPQENKQLVELKPKIIDI